MEKQNTIPPPPFTEEDLNNCWALAHHRAYLLDILNGDYDLKDAREDLRGLIGSEFDKRVEKKEQP